MNLQAQFFALSAERRRGVHFALCQHALQIWQRALADQQITYHDSVVGLKHTLDQALPAEAYQAALAGQAQASLDKRYLEPLVALQDEDLELPGPLSYAFYALYHLYQKYAKGAEVDDWLIVNQALAAENDQQRWLQLMQAALEP